LRVLIAILILIATAAINFFAVKFGAEDTRPFVRYTSVASGCLAIVCAIATPGAFLRFLLSADTLALTSMFISGAVVFTSISFALGVAIAIRLQRNAA
jgi:hypothetical protein